MSQILKFLSKFSDNCRGLDIQPASNESLKFLEKWNFSSHQNKFYFAYPGRPNLKPLKCRKNDIPLSFFPPINFPGCFPKNWFEGVEVQGM